MRVFILPHDPPFGQFLDITGKEYHYLARVRRLKVGEQFPGTDALGGRWQCTIVSIGPSSLRLQLEQSVTFTEPQQPSIQLIQCLPKATKMDLIVRQSTEAGVRRVIPVYSRYSQVRLKGRQEAEKKLARWQRIADQALQQSGAPRPPLIEPPQEIQTVLENLQEEMGEEVRLFFHQDREGSDTLHGCLSKSVKIVTLVVGPEGGLSEGEIDLLRQKRFVPVTVGNTVLRTETAALYAIAAVQIVVHERRAWEPT
ncbi:MAG: 16S rRNA (uracil(1498)-N(3))-methyltransferase [Spirochaetaceae bacterium]|nr:MAG: 16S rRNA (uracil(1498)-N(3))-methyltransferase [Spirochaetaceae bacterium]